MQIPRRTIDSSLTQKGFVKEQKDHTYYYHEHEGRRTGALALLRFSDPLIQGGMI
jgi:hypothetical protein